MAASAAALAMLDPPAALAQGSAVAPPRAEPMASASMNAPDMAPVARGSDAASVELDRLETLLKHYQAEEESHGLWSGLSGIALGGAIAPLGLVIYNRTQRQSLVGPLMFVVGVGLFAGGTGTLIAPLLPPPTGFASLTDSLARQRVAGTAPDRITALIESEWEALARKARSDRRFTGGINLLAAPVLIGVGTYIMLAKPSELSEQGRLDSSALLFGTGALGLLRGVHMLLVESNLEVAWNTYQLSARPRVQRLSFGYSPEPGGGTVQLAIAF